jgi:hypothetical protein
MHAEGKFACPRGFGLSNCSILDSSSSIDQNSKKLDHMNVSMTLDSFKIRCGGGAKTALQVASGPQTCVAKPLRVSSAYFASSVQHGKCQH